MKNKRVALINSKAMSQLLTAVILTTGSVAFGNADMCSSQVTNFKSSLDKAKALIPPNGKYDINSPNWPQVKLEGGKLAVSFPGKTSMCTSATATVLLQQIADTLNSGGKPISPAVVKFLGEKKSLLKFGMNGNTYAPAGLINLLGGKSIRAEGPAKIKEMLSQAQPGDQFIYARKKGGHATTFVGLKGNQACFLSSQKRTNGMGEACVEISKLQIAAVSRLPADPNVLLKNINSLMKGTPPAKEPETLWGKIEAMASNVWQGLRSILSSQSSANRVAKKDINWSQKLPRCNAVADTKPAQPSRTAMR